MTMSFQEASQDGVHLRQCEHCGEWFESDELTEMVSKHYDHLRNEHNDQWVKA